MPEPVSWASLIYLVGILILIFPAALMIFRQPSALRNAVIWLFLLAALMWGYHYFVQLPEYEENGNQERIEEGYTPGQSENSSNEGPVRRGF